jgi:hypothetical protein
LCHSTGITIETLIGPRVQSARRADARRRCRSGQNGQLAGDGPEIDAPSPTTASAEVVALGPVDGGGAEAVAPAPEVAAVVPGEVVARVPSAAPPPVAVTVDPPGTFDASVSGTPDPEVTPLRTAVPAAVLGAGVVVPEWASGPGPLVGEPEDVASAPVVARPAG